MSAVFPSTLHEAAPHRSRWIGCHLACVLALAAPLAAAEPPSSLSIPFRLVSPNRFIIVNLTVGALTDVPFILDTASSSTVISEKLAERLSLACGGQRVTMTQTGRRRLPTATLHTVRIGSISVNELPVLVTNLARIAGIVDQVDGVLGQDVLQQFNYLIDYRERRLEIDLDQSLRPRLQGEWLPFSLENRRLLVHARLRENPLPLVLAVDSAASSVVLFAHDDLAVDLQGRLEQVRLLSMLGENVALRGYVQSIEVGDQMFRRVLTTLTDMPRGWIHVEQDGLLPTSLFESIYVDNLTRAIMFNPLRADPTPRRDAGEGTQ
ncbi:MAG: retropepsin-like aspartic protease [Vicinamibacterales bacterium]